MPELAPIMKVSACRDCGANVIVHGSHIGESKTHAMKIGKEKNMRYVNGLEQEKDSERHSYVLCALLVTMIILYWLDRER